MKRKSEESWRKDIKKSIDKGKKKKNNKKSKKDFFLWKYQCAHRARKQIIRCAQQQKSVPWARGHGLKKALVMTHESWSLTKGKREQSWQDNNWQTVSVRDSNYYPFYKIVIASTWAVMEWFSISFQTKSKGKKLNDFAGFVELNDGSFLLFFFSKNYSTIIILAIMDFGNSG